MSVSSRTALILLAMSAVGLSSRTAFAQAWVGPSGSLSVALDYSYGFSDQIIEEEVDNDVVSIPGSPIDNHTVAISGEYIPIEKLAIQATVPIVTSTFKGTNFDRLPPHGRYDDGGYHSTLQDFRLAARYMVLSDPLAISPHLAVSIPMVDYETVGFAAAGRGLKQLHLGASLGKFFTSGVPNLYVHGTYEFSLVEAYETGFPLTEEYGQNKSDIKLLVGYFITESLDINVAADMRLSHGGLRFLEFDDAPPEVQYFHDPLLAEEFLLLGAGVSYQLTETLRLSAFFRKWISGENTRDADVLGMGVGWDVM